MQIPRLNHGLQAQIGPHQYVVYMSADPFGGQFQFVDSAGNTYRPQEFNQVFPLLPGVGAAKLVAAGKQPSGFRDATLQGTHLRIYTVQLYAATAGDSGLAIEVASSLTNVDKELSRIRLWLFVVALGGIALASGAGFLVARTTIRPVRELSETAERVRATRDLSQRIDVQGTDELGTLASTFNAMLESLDEAAQRQRQLVQDASHELRTPLTSLRTNIEVLAASEGLPPADREQLLRDVVEQLGEMTALIGELTELARGEEQASQLEEVRLDLVTEDAIRRAARNHPEVSIEADLAPTHMIGTPASLERAIANLLDNAAKWSPNGGSIEVRLADGELTVRDHGPGIAAADVPHIFDRFYRATTARSMPGSGLGLAIVRQVAESHGGTIEVESPPEGGTLMRLQLPVENGSPKNGADAGRLEPEELLSS